MMPEARKLVTTGFYSIVRHPMYLSEQIAIAGIVIQSRFPYALALFTIHFWIQIQRMKNEEKVLLKTFPEYEGYKLRTARLIPHVY
jgi:protein-S-isoprenylcysteine O-methyltransferase Ste14